MPTITPAMRSADELGAGIGLEGRDELGDEHGASDRGQRPSKQQPARQAEQQQKAADVGEGGDEDRGGDRGVDPEALQDDGE